MEDVSASSPVRFTWPDGSTVSGGGVLGALTEGLQTTLPGVAAGYDEVATALVDPAERAAHPRPGAGRLLRTARSSSSAPGPSRRDDRGEPGPDGRPDAAGGGRGRAPAPRTARSPTGSPALATAAGGPDELWGRFVVRTGVEVNALDGRAAVAARVAASAQDALLSATGVDLDEEMTNLVMFQRAYEGAARVMTAVDQALDTLINRTGVVGR